MCLKDITLIPGYLKGWQIFDMTAVIHGPKTFQGLKFKAVKNRKGSGYIDCQQVRSIALTEICFFFQTKATHFETVMTTVDEVNSDLFYC